jgi:SulP family sulfate permease
LQPLPLLLQTFGHYLEPPHTDNPEQAEYLSDTSINFLQSLIPYFTQVSVLANTILWRQYDPADGLYLIESGSLRATYAYESVGVGGEMVQETMVAGTVAGDLSMLSGTCRTATTIAERDCVLWKLDSGGLERLERDDAGVARRFVRIVLKGEWGSYSLPLDEFIKYGLLITMCSNYWVGSGLRSEASGGPR